MTETIEQNGDPVNYQYNAQGLVTEESFADGTSESFTYDAQGNMLTAETFDATGTLTGTTTLTYNTDAQGQDIGGELASITYPNWPVSQVHATTPRASALRASISPASR